MPDTITKIAVVDDHALFRKGLINLILSFDSSYSIIIEAENGHHLLEQLQINGCPDIVIMDMSMPKMDGFELTKAIKKLYPNLPILVVSMIHQEASVIRMIRAGVKGYLSKDIDPDELSQAIKSVINDDYHYTDIVTGKLINSMIRADKVAANHTLNDREHTFLKLACTEDTYQEIADKMFLSIKTIDGYRASLFDKLNIKSRTGLVLYGIKNGLVPID